MKRILLKLKKLNLHRHPERTHVSEACLSGRQGSGEQREEALRKMVRRLQADPSFPFAGLRVTQDDDPDGWDFQGKRPDQVRSAYQIAEWCLVASIILIFFIMLFHG